MSCGGAVADARRSDVVISYSGRDSGNLNEQTLQTVIVYDKCAEYAQICFVCFAHGREF